MLRIWKYPIEICDEQNLEMPRGAELLHVEVQGPTPCIWALVDTCSPVVMRTILIYGTGHPITTPFIRHIGSFLMLGGQFVWHVFEPVPGGGLCLDSGQGGAT